MNIRMLAITPNAEELIEYAGHICWRTDSSPTKTDRKRFIKMLIEQNHMSVIEHPSASFEINGISRVCSHQIVRHRLASYSQESMRYVNMDNQPFRLPPSIAATEKATRIWSSTAFAAQEAYQNLCKLVNREDARFVLPLSTTTRIIVTMNFRSWRHFIKLRCGKHAQWEIREVATQILRILYQEAPSIFDDLANEFLVCHN